MANGGREQLFNRKRDPNELSNCVNSSSSIRDDLYALAVKACRIPGAVDALEGDKLRAFPFRKRPPKRIYQFDRSQGVLGFPDKPQDALKGFDRGALKRVK
jgi:choline-sulfatase